MSNRSSSSFASQGGIDFFAGMTYAFIILKLLGEQFHTPVAEWAWIWVLCPMLIPLMFFVAFMGFCMLMALIRALLR